MSKKNHPKIGFRVDAGTLLGTGHLMEVLSLIRALRERMAFHPVLLTRKDPFTIAKLNEAAVETICFLPQTPSEEEGDQVLSHLRNLGCAHLICDLLGYSPEYYALLHQDLATTVVILDTGEHVEIDATRVVNYSIMQDPDFYRGATRYKTKYCLGPRYFPFDPSIKECAPPALRERVERVFINQGGSDPYGLTAKIIRAVERVEGVTTVDVVVGGGMSERHRHEIESMKPSLRHDYRFFSDLGPKEFFGLIGASDIALTAPGNTIYEIAYLGVPALIISHHARHLSVASAFAALGAGIDLGIGTEITEEAIAQALCVAMSDGAARSSMARKARDLVASFQGEPLVDEVVSLYS